MIVRYLISIIHVLNKLQLLLFFPPDYFVLLFLSMKHLRIIQLESKLLHQNRVFAGGNNTPLTDYESTGMNNTRNFYEHMHSSLDIIKSYIFGTFLWMTLTFVFVVYKGQPYIFSLGYMTSVFLLLWWVLLFSFERSFLLTLMCHCVCTSIYLNGLCFCTMEDNKSTLYTS